MIFWNAFVSHQVLPSASATIAFFSSSIEAVCSTNPTAPPFSPTRSISSRSSRVSSKTGATRAYSRINPSSSGALCALTVNGELSNLRHNVSFDHGIHAAIHYRSDTEQSMLLGEAVALAVL